MLTPRKPPAAQAPPTLAVTMFEPDELSCYHANPRRGDVSAIVRSLERNGQYRAIVVNLGSLTGRPLEVLAGNHTLLAARKLGWSSVAATTVDVDDVAAARIVAADNRTADLGGYDNDVLAELLQTIPDLDGTGYSQDDLDALLGVDNDDEPEDAPVESIPVAWGVVVDCDSEEQQAALLEHLLDEGWKNVRALM